MSLPCQGVSHFTQAYTNRRDTPVCPIGELTIKRTARRILRRLSENVAFLKRCSVKFNFTNECSGTLSLGRSAETLSSTGASDKGVV